MSIQKDLLIGKQAEQRLVNFLESKKYNCEIANKYEYDIVAKKQGKEVTFEVKNDIMAAKTGNIAIEYYNTKSNKPSGITGTRALFWVHITSDIYIIKTELLRELLKTIKPKRTIKSGGDNNANLYLYPHQFLIDNFFLLEHMKVRALNKYLLKE
jgi:hypothetical protein